MIFQNADYYMTLYFIRPLSNLLLNIEDNSLPVLMYHSISDNLEDNKHPYFRLNTSVEIFNKHCEYLAANNYSVITMEDMKDFFTRKDKKKCVIITFDDGYQDFYVNAFPVLDKFKYKSTVFLPTAYIQNNRKMLNNRANLTWPEVRELSRSGINFGAHSVNHTKLSSLPLEKLNMEISQSIKDIEDNVGISVNSFCYPYGFPECNKDFTENFKKLLLRAGVEFSFTTILGTIKENDDFLLLKRLPINSADDTKIYEAKLKGHYNWIHKFQYLYKYYKQC